MTYRRLTPCVTVVSRHDVDQTCEEVAGIRVVYTTPLLYNERQFQSPPPNGFKGSALLKHTSTAAVIPV
jgi:hypothetical protein